MTVFETKLQGLFEAGHRLWLPRPGQQEPIPVTVRYLRPLTNRREVIFLDDKEREVATIAGVEVLTGAARSLVEAALDAYYHLAIVQRVIDVQLRLGTRFWTVETHRGDRVFALRSPSTNVTWLSDSHLVLRDTAGNRFEIPNLNALDIRSRKLALRFT